MTSSPKILVVAADPALRNEAQAALAGLSSLQPVVYFATDYRQGVEAARNWQPALTLVEMGADRRALTTFVEGAIHGAPGTAVVVAFRPDDFGGETSESAVLIEAVRAGARDFVRRPLSSTDLGPLFDRLIGQSIQSEVREGKIVAFLSNKGGVGKSTLAVNVACGVARRRAERVLLIDASLQMGVCSTLLDLKPVTTIHDAARELDRLDATLLRQLAAVHPCGLHLLASPNNALEAAEISDDAFARVLTIARRAYDLVIVDTFPLLDRVVMALLDLTDRSYLVLENVVPTVLSMVKLLELLEELGYPKDKQRVVVNRYAKIPGNPRAAEIAERLGQPVDHIVAYSKQIVVSANTGRPYLLGGLRWFGPSRALEQICQDVEAMIQRPDPLSNGRATSRGPAFQETP